MKTRWLAAGALVGGLLVPGPVRAQETAFLAAVEKLAANPGWGGARESTAAALAEWDREIARLGDPQRLADSERFERHLALGLAYRRRGRLDDALRQFDAAAALRAEASDVHLLRGLTLETSQPLSGGPDRRDEAGQAFHAAWRRDAANPVKAYHALRSANLDAADRKRAMGALRQALQQLISSDSRPVAPPFLVIDLVPDAYSRAPIVGAGALASVFAHLAAGRLDEAVAAFDAVPPAAGPGPGSPLERGRAAEAEGRFSDAVREYSTALTATLAGRHALLVAIGRLMQVQGDTDAAIDAFARAARLNPNDPIIRRELAAAYMGAGRTDEAFTELVAALLIAPRNTEALADIAQIHLDTDRPADAIPLLQRLLAIDANRYQTHYALAMALSRAGRSEEAAREFQQFERLSGNALDARRRAVTGEAGPPPEPSRAPR